MKKLSLSERAEVLVGFESLPDVAEVDMRVVGALLGLHPKTIRLHVEGGKVPAPVTVTGVLRWRVGDLRAATAR